MSRTRWLGAAALALVVSTGAALVRVLSDLLSSRDLASFHGVRLGMSPSDVRASLDIPGRLLPRPSASGLAFELVGGEHATVTTATFEFEDGALVAVRADLTGADDLAEGPRLERDVHAVRARRFVSARRVLLTILAPRARVNAAEVEQLIEGS